MAQSETPARGDETNVLDHLDTTAMSCLYWYLALLACIGGFLFGYDTAVIGSVLDFIPYELSDFWTGYLVAGASLGAAVGALGAGPADGPLRPQVPADGRRRHLRPRRAALGLTVTRRC